MNNIDCTTCGAESWGPKCQYSCAAFEDDSSHYVCTDHCRSGFYFKDQKCHQCPDNCETCLKYTGCDTCGADRWGPECQYSCSVCEDCSRYPCTDQCDSGLYLKDDTCHRCPENCETCLKYTGCDTCGADKWGPECQYSCSVCEDCSRYPCTDQCDSGLYLKDDSCHRCPENCETCLKYTGCNTCEAGFWDPSCDYDCSICPGVCSVDSRCQCVLNEEYLQNNNGIFECVKCPNNCKSCSDSRHCTTCHLGYFGSVCQFSCQGCMTSCNRNQGCTGRCSKGYYKLIHSDLISNSLNLGLSVCEKCPDSCKSCTSSDQCHLQIS